MSDSDTQFFNRELSWLEFNQRVLDEARDETIPLLERLKFLAITSTNLDEFFMVRVGGLQTLSERGSTRRDSAGMTPEEQLVAISRRTHKLVSDQYECWLQELAPRLSQAGLCKLRPEDLSAAQTKYLTQYFSEEVASILAPLAVRGQVPLLANRSVSICVRLEHAGHDEGGDARTATRYVFIPFGSVTRRIVTLPSDGQYSFVLLEDLIAMFASEFFPDEKIIECTPFRVTRNADLEFQEEEASDLLAQMRELLTARKESDCVRLEVAAEASDELIAFLQKSLEVPDRDVYRCAGPLDLSALMQLAEAGTGDENRYESWPPLQPADVDPLENIFETIARQDVLLYHPYDSFDPVVQLVEQAADDPDVLAIKQTLYRTSRNSPVISALARAAQNGKHVTVFIELKARFDEQRNIEGARSLERAGVQVFYGVKGLKTHAKICIIVRREPHGIQRYVHFGTGNYNEATARIYSDASLLTCHDEFGSDAMSFFNAITGHSQPQPFRRLAAAPFGLRDRLREMIEAEIQFRQQRQKAQITAKLNSLVDPEIIQLLYKASQAGVKIRLNIRGVCCLRPGVKGLSENIEVVNIIDRFLEHTRMMHFLHGGDNHVLISSADWMPRNFDRRIELLVPVDDPACRNRLIDILQCCFRDQVKGRWLQPDGTWQPIQNRASSLKVPVQEWLYTQTRQLFERAEISRKTAFEPHRAPNSE
jgi:polyphosphate kinase